MIQSLFAFNYPRQFVGLTHFTRNCSNSLVLQSEVVAKKNALFSQEQKRQLEEVGRIEKITVEVSGPPENVTLVMNKGISTPYECCKHISLGLCQQAALALVNNNDLWDMHRPLPDNCSLKFLTFKDKDPYHVNKTFWRTGSFILGAIVSKVFKDDLTVHLHSFPPPFIKSGSFIYDASLNLMNWEPTSDELKVLSAEFLTFVQQNHKLERLRVKKSLAAEIFEDNPFKSAQIPEIAASAKDHLVTLYRVGDHIDISNGPMVGDTSFFGRCTVTNVHRIGTFFGDLYRFQGVALPKGILLNSYAYNIIVNRGTHLNEADIPGRVNKPSKFQENLCRIFNISDKTSYSDVPKHVLENKIF